MTDQRARVLIARYDLVDVTRCGEGWREMQRDDQYGDWVSYEDHIAALADERRRVWEEAAKAVLQTTIKLDVDWMRTATKAETIAETLRQASAALSAKAHAGQEG